MLSALVGVKLTGGDNNMFVQVGLVVLMGLACKNAILIVEFARELELQGKGIVEAALEACRLRLRPIVMTSIAFIAGTVPLVLSHGAGAEVRSVTGITVFAGMLGVTLFGLFLTPVFYVALRKLVDARRRAFGCDGGDCPCLTSFEETLPCVNRKFLAHPATGAGRGLARGLRGGPDSSARFAGAGRRSRVPSRRLRWRQRRNPVRTAARCPRPPTTLLGRFGDPQLTALVEEALLANHDLRIALARYDGANALLRDARFDQIADDHRAGHRERLAPQRRPGARRAARRNATAESYCAGAIAAWELDLFGRVRRNVEAQPRGRRSERAGPGRVAGRDRRRRRAQLLRTARPAGTPARRARQRDNQQRDAAHRAGAPRCRPRHGLRHLARARATRSHARERPGARSGRRGDRSTASPCSPAARPTP